MRFKTAELIRRNSGMSCVEVPGSKSKAALSAVTATGFKSLPNPSSSKRSASSGNEPPPANVSATSGFSAFAAASSLRATKRVSSSSHTFHSAIAAVKSISFCDGEVFPG